MLLQPFDCREGAKEKISETHVKKLRTMNARIDMVSTNSGIFFMGCQKWCTKSETPVLIPQLGKSLET